MQFNKAFQKITVYSLAFLLLSAAIPPAAMAGRYVLNQTPQTIQRYFGCPLETTLSSVNISKKVETLHTTSLQVTHL